MIQTQIFFLTITDLFCDLLWACEIFHKLLDQSAEIWLYPFIG